MRISVTYEDVRQAIDIKPDDSVAKLKDVVNSKMIIDATEDKKVGKYLELKFGGAPLHDDWVLQDIGVTSGATIKCSLKTVEKPKLLIYLGYNKEVLKITQDLDPISMTVGSVRSILSDRLGIPVSAFRLSFAPESKQVSQVDIRKCSRESLRLRSAKNNAKQLYDTNTLDYYGIEIGSKINLDLWDGWNELIMTAIAGHEKTVMQYFSWDSSIRHFQQKVALYVASYHGHMGLATAMMKRGARGHVAVGSHPSRKWCFESEHPETRRCPLHVACSNGHLPILRLFVKNSPLCFITRDEKGRTPLQIVIRNRHRPCFKFLIARQWGRKTCKDFSIPMTLYCKIIQWCERAKMRALLMYGTEKSTFKGFPQKEGALVGTSLLVDGFSKMPANSVPYALVPKPPIPPEKMIFALALTKRKLRAMRIRKSSSRIISRRSSAISLLSGGMRERKTSVSSSFSSQSSLSLDKVNFEKSGNRKTKYDHLLKNDGNRRSGRKKSAQFSNVVSKSLSGKDIEVGFMTNSKHSKSSPQLHAIDEKISSKKLINDMHSFSTPRIGKTSRLLCHKDSRISFQRDHQLRRNNRSRQYPSFAALRPYGMQPAPAVKRLPAIPLEVKVTETGIPLPSKSVERQLKPFFYWSPYEKTENPVDSTLTQFRSHAGVTPRQHAVQCLTVTSSFTEKPWLEQLRMAVCLTKRSVKKNYNSPVVA